MSQQTLRVIEKQRAVIKLPDHYADYWKRGAGPHLRLTTILQSNEENKPLSLNEAIQDLTVQPQTLPPNVF